MLGVDLPPNHQAHARKTGGQPAALSTASLIGSRLCSPSLATPTASRGTPSLLFLDAILPPSGAAAAAGLLLRSVAPGHFPEDATKPVACRRREGSLQLLLHGEMPDNPRDLWVAVRACAAAVLRVSGGGVRSTERGVVALPRMVQNGAPG